MTSKTSPTPIEYNGCQLANEGADKLASFALNIDFLKINFLNILDIKDSGNFRFEQQGWGNKFFHNRYKVFYQETEFGELITNPRSAILDSTLVQLRISNHNFYGAIDLYKALSEWVDTMQMKFHSINRLDVAYDCHKIAGHTPLEIIHLWEAGHILLKGRKKAYNTYKDVVEGRPRITGYSWGNRENTERFLRIYNKSVEMQKKEKDYILQEWKKNGLETEKQDVYRIEIQLSNRFLKKYGFLWAELVKSKKTLVEILRLGLANFFEFVKDEGAKETNKNPPYELFDFEGLNQYFEGYEHKLIKLAKNVKAGSRRAKMITLKGLLRQYFQTFQEPIYAIVARSFIESNGLEKFYQKKIDDWLQEFLTGAIKNEFDYEAFREHLELEI